ncbi:hypothetical protein BGW38_004256 [Lunasporangiospora selenospora]|uniref:Secreted protein n=1 Tax=Lunasporangiospora selenospora TaxID=979761 RepID=A0A9P6FRL4_9FUNG|nr:hypothetical protein BGW38_004256 [Lunasporangiospora selenospora]
MPALTKLVFLAAATTIAVLFTPTPVSAGGRCEIQFQPGYSIKFDSLMTYDMDGNGRCKISNVCDGPVGWSHEKFFEECKRCFHYATYSKNDGCVKISKRPPMGGEYECRCSKAFFRGVCKCDNK